MIALAPHIECVRCAYKMKGVSKLHFILLRQKNVGGQVKSSTLFFP